MKPIAALLPAGLVGLGLACASSGAPGAHGSDMPEPLAPSLRLLRIEPAPGTAVDSATTLRATLAWRVPPTSDTLRYSITPLFAGPGRPFSNPAAVRAILLDAEAGTVEVTYPLAPVLEGGTEPGVSGAFVLMAMPLTPPTGAREDTIEVLPGRLRLRRAVVSRGPVARTRAFFYGQGGPAASPPGPQTLAGYLEEFLTYAAHRALAVAVDSTGAWTVGYAWSANTPSGAAATAMRHCLAGRARRSLSGACEVVALNHRLVPPGAMVPGEGVQLPHEPPGRVIHARRADRSAAAFVDSASVDLDGDGELERIELRAARTARDGVTWRLTVQTGDTHFLLAEHMLPAGAMSFAVADDGTGSTPMLLLSRGSGARGLEVFQWDRARQAFIVRSLDMEARIERAGG